MTFVLDCSITLAWVFPDEGSEEAGRLLDSLADGRAYVPSLWPIEIASALLSAARRDRMTADEWPAILAHLTSLPIEIDPVSADRVWGPATDLASKFGLSVYDAMYLELALRTQLPLSSLDRKLMSAAKSVGVDAPVVE